MNCYRAGHADGSAAGARSDDDFVRSDWNRSGSGGLRRAASLRSSDFVVAARAGTPFKSRPVLASVEAQSRSASRRRRGGRFTVSLFLRQAQRHAPYRRHHNAAARPDRHRLGPVMCEKQMRKWNRAWKIIERENPERRDLAEVLVQRLVPAGAGTTLCFALTKKAGLMPGHRHPTAIGRRGADTRERATSSPPWRSRRPWRRPAP